MTIVTKNSLTLSNINDGTITHYAYANSADGKNGFYVGGATNLLQGTQDFSGSNWLNLGSSWIKTDETYNGLSVVETTSDWNGIAQYYQVKQGETYTFSLFARYTSGTGTSIFYISLNSDPENGHKNAQVNNGTLACSLDTNWKKCSITFTATADGYVKPRMERTNNNTNVLRVCGLMFEEGTIAHPWSPAPSEAHPSYIGQYTDFNTTASTDPAKYAPWIIFKGDKGNMGKSVWSYPYDRGANRLGNWWSDLKPTPTTDNPPKVGDTIIDLVGNIYQITNVVVGTTREGGGLFDYGPMLTSVKGADGDPGKIVSDTEPTTRFKGLTWKYSGASDLTASDGTVILSGTEYYWSGTNWILSEINAHNINGNNLTITDGEFSSTIINGPVQIQTEIKDDHLLIYKMDTSHNEIHTIALKSDSGLGMTYQNSDTGEYTSAGVNFQGLFMQNNITNEFARLTPRGTDLSTDVPWTNLTLASGFSIGSGGKARYRVKNGVLYIHFRKIVCPAITGNQPNTLCYVPANGRASDGYDSFGVMSATNSTRIQYNDSGDGKVAIVPASNTTAGQGFNGFLICPMD